MKSILQNDRTRTVILGFLLVLAIFLAYARVWHAGFIWDDDDHLTNNPCILGPLGFSHIWTSSAAVYYPLVLTSFWIEHALWGLNPLPYHLVTVWLHVSSALLLWVVLARLNVRGAWLGAALWALHPVQVESVAWITEQKNTQSCLFYLLSIYFFLRWRDRADAKSPVGDLGMFFYLLSALCAAFGILSKSSTVMLPVVLCIIFWWREREWRWAHLKELAPFFFISLGAGLWTVWEQKYHSGAIGGSWEMNPLQRLILAGKVPWFYLGKLAWPHPLIFIYPKWVIDPAQVTTWIPFLGVPLGLVILWLMRGKEWARSSFFAATYFLVSLFPVMGFFNIFFFRYSYVGDHFQYLASIGPMSLAGAGITMGTGFLARGRHWVLLVIASVLLVLLGLLSWLQCGQYAGLTSLWREILFWNPECGLANNNLGTIVLQDGKVDEAISHFEKALASEPNDAFAQCNMGWALRQKHMFTEALPYFKGALVCDPNFVKETPNFTAGVHYNMGDTLFQMGHYEEAIQHFQTSMSLNPEVDSAELGIAQALLAQGNEESALTHLRHLLLLKPHDAPTLHTLGKLLYKRGGRKEGIAHLQKGLESHPEMSLLNDLAWMLATAPEKNLRNGPLALQLAERVNKECNGTDPVMLDTLAAAYAETGDFGKALESAHRALTLAEAYGNKDLLKGLKKEIILYEASKPLREP